MDFFIRHKTIVFFIGALLFCVISLSTQSSKDMKQNPVTFSLEGIGSAIIRPFKYAINGISSGVSSIFGGVNSANYKKIEKQIKITEKKLLQYNILKSQLNEVIAENTKLRKILSMKSRISYDTISAEIISKDPDNWYKTIIIDRGRDDGVKVNMPVIVYIGEKLAVVGKIIEVRSSVSRIRPLTSPRLKVGVKMASTNYPGLLFGFSIRSDSCIMDYIARAAQLKENDIVITSGQAGIFPAGLFIGKIKKSRILESGSYQRAIVKPFVDYTLLEKVYVIKRDPLKEFLKMIESKK